MQKRGLIVAFVLCCVLMFSSFALAAENDSASGDKVKNAYLCIESQIDSKEVDGLSLQDSIFGILASGGRGKLAQKIDDEKDSSNDCWPKGACKIKETAQVGLAYNRIGSGTGGIRNWLHSKNTSVSELNWYLEIDIANAEAATCTLTKGTEKATLNVGTSMKFSGSPGRCFSLARDGYWLKISASCMNSEITISCDKDFTTAVFYQKGTGGAYFVSSKTQTSPPGGSTTENPTARCFKTGGSCDYEGTLWAALFMNKAGLEITEYTPYLLAYADDNSRYFPSTFLYMLVGGEEFYDKIAQSQKQNKFWELTGSPYNRYYDTSLAMLALSSAESGELQNAKDYLLGVQGADGCWNSGNIRDTGFILYSGWPKSVGGGSGRVNPQCSAPDSCENMFRCTDEGGEQTGDDCPNAGEVCCTVPVEEETCSEKGGEICEDNEDCAEGFIESASDGSCCIDGTCAIVEEPANACVIAGGTCSISCGDDETESSDACLTSDDVCCMEKEGGALGWIIFLVILIALVALAIVFREKVKSWWYKIADKFKKKPSAPGAPGMPGARPIIRQNLPPSGYYPRPIARPMPARPAGRDREMEDTLKKLKEIGK